MGAGHGLAFTGGEGAGGGGGRMATWARLPEPPPTHLRKNMQFVKRGPDVGG